MFAASNEQDFLCRVFGKCLHGSALDREVWDMQGANGQGPVSPKLCTYMRDNADVTREGLHAWACHTSNLATSNRWIQSIISASSRKLGAQLQSKLTSTISPVSCSRESNLQFEGDELHSVVALFFATACQQI